MGWVRKVTFVNRFISDCHIWLNYNNKTCLQSACFSQFKDVFMIGDKNGEYLFSHIPYKLINLIYTSSCIYNGHWQPL